MTGPESFEVNGSADYDLSMIRDVLFVPNGINSAYLEENYVLTGYINDINTQYTQVLAEYGNSDAYTSVYEYGMQRTSMYQNGQVYSYEYDGRGSVSELVNAVGKTQIKYGYGAYGETVSTVIGWNNPVTNPYRYNAERIDDVAGAPAFQYLRARYLNPYTASFLTQDSYLGQLASPLSQNRYAYAHNNPVMYTDPSGHFIITALVVTGLALVGVGATTYFVADAVEDDAINSYNIAVEDYENSLQSIQESSSRISQIYQDIATAYFTGGSIDVNSTYLALKTAYINYGNAYAKACFGYDEAKAQAERAGKAGTWKKIGFGVGVAGLGIAAIGFAPALPTAANSMGYLFYGSYAKALTAGGMAIGGATTGFGVSDITEGITGYNPVKELVFQGDAAAYSEMEGYFISASGAVVFYGNMGYQIEKIQQKTTANFDVVGDSKDGKETKTLYHYTNEKGMNGIVESKQLNPSLKANNPKDARYGDGQYLSDIKPDTQTPVSLAKKFINVPNKYKYTHYVEINVTDLEVIQGREGVFVIPNSSPLDLTNRIISTGPVGIQ